MNTPRIGLGLGSGLGNIISRTVNETSQAPKPTYVSYSNKDFVSMTKLSNIRTFQYPSTVPLRTLKPSVPLTLLMFLYLISFIRNSFNKDFLSIHSTIPNDVSDLRFPTILILIVFQGILMDMMMISKEFTLILSEYNWTEERLMAVWMDMNGKEITVSKLNTLGTGDGQYVPGCRLTNVGSYQ